MNSMKFRPRVPPRTLSERSYVAQQIHHCDRCMREIMPGDIYRRQVILHKNTNHPVVTYKTHEHPYCRDEDLEDFEREAETSGKERELEQSVKAAA